MTSKTLDKNQTILMQRQRIFQLEKDLKQKDIDHKEERNDYSKAIIQKNNDIKFLARQIALLEIMAVRPYNSDQYQVAKRELDEMRK